MIDHCCDDCCRCDWLGANEQRAHFWTFGCRRNAANRSSWSTFGRPTMSGIGHKQVWLVSANSFRCQQQHEILVLGCGFWLLAFGISLANLNGLACWSRRQHGQAATRIDKHTTRIQASLSTASTSGWRRQFVRASVVCVICV